ncbi:hypothetical protein [Microseira sp. BLCC-F43]|jgi:hypothetical protein|uniref:hypothetical protein n=1 Tax=Microseira sp. BLCC-F43 TaxID=3153602 RepID=UPI0035B79EED
MQRITVWQQGSTKQENPNNFAIIKQWFASLNGQEITWRQRLIPPTADVGEIDWEPQRFDELFLISNPEIRGITLYWRKPDSQQERSTTPHKLELDMLRQQLYIYPQSQREIVIRVGLKEAIYQKFELNNPQVEYNQEGEGCILTLRDNNQLLEVKVTFSPENLQQFKQLMP